MSAPKFHRDGNVTVEGRLVGTYHRPDPSGRNMVRFHQFRSVDGVTTLQRQRGDLAVAIRAAATRRS